jgi:GxxExxY protein
MPEILYKSLSYQIVGAAMEVHRILGPGFLESVYHSALAHEMELCGLQFEQLKQLPVAYKGVPVGHYIADFVVHECVVLEIKAVSKWHPRHQAQALNYLAASGLRLSILINFGESSLKQWRIAR